MFLVLSEGKIITEGATIEMYRACKIIRKWREVSISQEVTSYTTVVYYILVV